MLAKVYKAFAYMFSYLGFALLFASAVVHQDRLAENKSALDIALMGVSACVIAVGFLLLHFGQTERENDNR